MIFLTLANYNKQTKILMKTNTLKSCFIAGMLALVASGFAQERATIFGKPLGADYINQETGKIQCVSYQYMEYLKDLDPSNFVARGTEEELPNVAEGTTEVLVIPVVVHVIHNGQSVGTGKNISDARVLSQIKVLNEDFRKKVGTPGNGSNPLGVDVEIEFCLAQTAPDGSATNGINRVNLGDNIWHLINVEGTLKPQTQWDPNRYFNIWVCEFGYHSNPNYDLEGVLGYAQFPSNSGLGGLQQTGQANTDGVIIDWRCFGRTTEAPGSYFSGYNRGRTTTHEVAHALGLRHIWGDNTNCTVNSVDSAQDYCPDTPPHKNANSSCTANSSTICTGYTPMPENYMDYGTDTCLNTFTANQKTRMRTALQNATRRSSLLTSDACQSPSASTDNFGLEMVSMYPNPASNVLNIVLPDNYELNGTVKVYNTLGQMVYNTSLSASNHHSIDVSGYQSGVYFVKVQNGSQTKTLQFVKQ